MNQVPKEQKEPIEKIRHGKFEELEIESFEEARSLQVFFKLSSLTPYNMTQDFKQKLRDELLSEQAEQDSNPGRSGMNLWRWGLGFAAITVLFIGIYLAQITQAPEFKSIVAIDDIKIEPISAEEFLAENTAIPIFLPAEMQLMTIELAEIYDDLVKAESFI